MASSALNQLIAMQRGPDIAGSVMGGIQAAKQDQAQARQGELQDLQLTTGKHQLAQMDQQVAQQKKAESLKFAADIGTQIKRETDPMKRAALYQQGRQTASFMGADTSWWPQEYDDQTQVGLDNAISHVYGGEQFKTDEKIREDAAKGQQPTSGVGKLMADRESAAQKGATPAVLKAYDDAIAKESSTALTPYQAEDLRIKRARLNDDVGVEQSFTPDAIANAAARYNIDGTLPPMGMGKAGAAGRSAILNKAAELASENGKSGDEQRIDQIGNKANTSALAQLQKQQTMVGAFEKNFNRNADISLELSKKVDRTGVPLVNKWINAGKRSIEGDADLAAYDASMKATSNEYAKIISGSMGNTALAEGEIKKIEGLLNSAQTPEQVDAVVNLMKRETQNRMKGFDEEKAQLRESMSAQPKRRASDNQSNTAVPPEGTTATNKQTGARMSIRDGKWQTL